MAIVIPHRFLDRLAPNNSTKKIRVLVIGTFNPGLPQEKLFNEVERKAFIKLKNEKQFDKINKTINFYDRSNNRFWKVMDYFNDPDFYLINDLYTHNPNGLKYYMHKGMCRGAVFERQKNFCHRHGIYITDIVKETQPKSFDGIFSGFKDNTIDQSASAFNTKNILETIALYKPKWVLTTFKLNLKRIPRITKELELIKAKSIEFFREIPSPGGNAGNGYDKLISSWASHFMIDKPAPLDVRQVEDLLSEIKRLLVSVKQYVYDFKYISSTNFRHPVVYKTYGSFIERMKHAVGVMIVLQLYSLYAKDEAFSFRKLLNKIRNNSSEEIGEVFSKTDIHNHLLSLNSQPFVDIFNKIANTRNKYYAHYDQVKPDFFSVQLSNREFDLMIEKAEELIEYLNESLRLCDWSYNANSCELGHKIFERLDDWECYREKYGKIKKPSSENSEYSN